METETKGVDSPCSGPTLSVFPESRPPLLREASAVRTVILPIFQGGRKGPREVTKRVAGDQAA